MHSLKSELRKQRTPIQLINLNAEFFDVIKSDDLGVKISAYRKWMVEIYERVIGIMNKAWSKEEQLTLFSGNEFTFDKFVQLYNIMMKN